MRHCSRYTVHIEHTTTFHCHHCASILCHRRCTVAMMPWSWSYHHHRIITTVVPCRHHHIIIPQYMSPLYPHLLDNTTHTTHCWHASRAQTLPFTEHWHHFNVAFALSLTVSPPKPEANDTRGHETIRDTSIAVSCDVRGGGKRLQRELGERKTR